MPLATNYRAHALALGYMLTDHVMLDGVFYHYRPLDAAYAGTNAPGNWLDRISFNISLNF